MLGINATYRMRPGGRAAFLREVCGTEPDPQDQALFQEVLESLGESQET